MKRRLARHLVLTSLFCVGCTSIAPAPAHPEPVRVSDARGTLPAARSAAAVARAVEASPDPASMQALMELMQTLSTEPLYKDNKVGLLVDGPATYAAMLDALRGARHYINLEMYIIGDDEVGRTFSHVLKQKAAQGVKVRLLYDSVGSREASDAFFDDLRNAGVEVIPFNPINPLEGGHPLKINNRDHRKVLVVDGQTAFTGGLNIDRNYSSGSSPGGSSASGHSGESSGTSGLSSRSTTDGASTVPTAFSTSDERDGGTYPDGSAHSTHSESGSVSSEKSQRGKPGWRDTDIVVQGPAVAALEDAFRDSWQRAGGTMDIETVEPTAHGQDLVRILSSVGGDGTVSPIRTAYELAFDNASSRVWITQPYFAPDKALLESLRDAVKRGVDVRLILPSTSDSAVVLNGARYHYTGLLEGGVRIFESNDSMLHAKTAVIDGVWSTVGSSNLDYRSFLHNDEINAVILGKSFGAQLEGRFEIDQAASTEITLADWKRRPLLDRVKQFFSHVFAYWL